MSGVKHSGYQVTIPLNKIEFIALGHTLGWVLLWIHPHCKGFHSLIPFDLHDPPAKEDIGEYSPADMDITFHKYLAQYRQELVDRECSRLLITRRAQIEGRKRPFMYGSQCTCIASPSTKFFMEQDRSSPCFYFSI